MAALPHPVVQCVFRSTTERAAIVEGIPSSSQTAARPRAPGDKGLERPPLQVAETTAAPDLLDWAEASTVIGPRALADCRLHSLGYLFSEEGLRVHQHPVAQERWRMLPKVVLVARG